MNRICYPPCTSVDPSTGQVIHILSLRSIPRAFLLKFVELSIFIHYWFFLQSSFGVSASPNAAAKSANAADCTTDWIGVRFSLKFHCRLRSSNYLDFQWLNAFICGIFLICRSKEEIQIQMLRLEPFLNSIVGVVENFFLQETLLGQQQSHQLLLFVVRTYYITIWRIQPELNTVFLWLILTF